MRIGQASYLQVIGKKTDYGVRDGVYVYALRSCVISPSHRCKTDYSGQVLRIVEERECVALVAPMYKFYSARKLRKSSPNRSKHSESSSVQEIRKQD